MATHNDKDWLPGFAWQQRVDPQPNEEKVLWTGILVKGGHVNKSSTPAKVWLWGKIGMKSIEDGTSNTILVAEKSVQGAYWNIPTIASTATTRRPHWEIYGYYVGADWPHMRQFGALTFRTGEQYRVPVRGDNDPRSTVGHPQYEEQGFGSAHPGIICAAFGDGSTRTLSQDADLNLLDQLGKRGDGTTVAVENL
jgi:hypothetical protein